MLFKCYHWVGLNISIIFVDPLITFFSIPSTSKCKYYICGSSNGALWKLFYRNNSYNVYQNSNNIWFN